MPGSFADGRVQVDKIAAANLEKPIASTEVKPPSSFALNEKSDSRTSDGYVLCQQMKCEFVLTRLANF